MGLVDAVGTSDEFIINACEDAEVYHVAYVKKKNIADKLGKMMESTLDNTLLRWLHRGRSKDELYS